MFKKIFIIIATSKKRTDIMINRALHSIYKQKDINFLNVEVIIVDDNKDSSEFNLIKKKIDEKRKLMFLKENEFKTSLIKNQRIKFHSGTGAWNTAIIDYIIDKGKGYYIGILDDDDEYLDNTICEVISILKKDSCIAIFPYIKWLLPENKFLIKKFNKNELNPKIFFIGNPGIQGSNMFFSIDSIRDINGFDESLKSATDRDLMIRFLTYIKDRKDQIFILKKVLVIHHAYSNDRVTSNTKLKKQGLDKFYKKYINLFTKDDFYYSLKRAKKLFGYEYE